jgi:hypothetical protein
MGIREAFVLNPSGITPVRGFMFSALIPHSSYHPFFRIEWPSAADTRLYEDTCWCLKRVALSGRLGPAHRAQNFIGEYGCGQFSHWGETIYFSTSDNSDPRTTGRTYSIVTTARLPYSVLLAWGALVLGDER